MSKIYRGGCAVMLSLSDFAPDPFQALIDAIPDAPETDQFSGKMPERLHVTLVFVGRDLSADDVAQVIGTSIRFFSRRNGPVPVRFAGTLEILRTSKGQYLVAPLSAPFLVVLRSQLIADLKLPIKDTFEFKPHMTLLEWPKSPAIDLPLRPFEPFEVRCSRAVVKYGSHYAEVEVGNE